MYTKCCSLEDARPIFDKIVDHNLVSWISMITTYTRYGNYNKVLKIFHETQRSGVKVNCFLYPSLLKACTSLTKFQQGKELHGSMTRNGFESQIFVESALVALYKK